MLLLRFGRAEPLGVVYGRSEGTRANPFVTVLIHLLARRYDHRDLPRESPAAVGECEWIDITTCLYIVRGLSRSIPCDWLATRTQGYRGIGPWLT